MTKKRKTKNSNNTSTKLNNKKTNTSTTLNKTVKGKGFINVNLAPDEYSDYCVLSDKTKIVLIKGATLKRYWPDLYSLNPNKDGYLGYVTNNGIVPMKKHSEMAKEVDRIMGNDSSLKSTTSTSTTNTSTSSSTTPKKNVSVRSKVKKLLDKNINKEYYQSPTSNTTMDDIIKDYMKEYNCSEDDACKLYAARLNWNYHKDMFYRYNWRNGNSVKSDYGDLLWLAMQKDLRDIVSVDRDAAILTKDITRTIRSSMEDYDEAIAAAVDDPKKFYDENMKLPKFYLIKHKKTWFYGRYGDLKEGRTIVVDTYGYTPEELKAFDEYNSDSMNQDRFTPNTVYASESHLNSNLRDPSENILNDLIFGGAGLIKGVVGNTIASNLTRLGAGNVIKNGVNNVMRSFTPSEWAPALTRIGVSPEAAKVAGTVGDALATSYFTTKFANEAIENPTPFNIAMTGISGIGVLPALRNAYSFGKNALPNINFGRFNLEGGRPVTGFYTSLYGVGIPNDVVYSGTPLPAAGKVAKGVKPSKNIIDIGGNSEIIPIDIARKAANNEATIRLNGKKLKNAHLDEENGVFRATFGRKNYEFYTEEPYQTIEDDIIITNNPGRYVIGNDIPLSSPIKLVGEHLGVPVVEINGYKYFATDPNIKDMWVTFSHNGLNYNGPVSKIVLKLTNLKPKVPATAAEESSVIAPEVINAESNVSDAIKPTLEPSLNLGTLSDDVSQVGNMEFDSPLPEVTGTPSTAEAVSNTVDNGASEGDDLLQLLLNLGIFTQVPGSTVGFDKANTYIPRLKLLTKREITGLHVGDNDVFLPSVKAEGNTAYFDLGNGNLVPIDMTKPLPEGVLVEKGAPRLLLWGPKKHYPGAKYRPLGSKKNNPENRVTLYEPLGWWDSFYKPLTFKVLFPAGLGTGAYFGLKSAFKKEPNGASTLNNVNMSADSAYVAGNYPKWSDHEALGTIDDNDTTLSSVPTETTIQSTTDNNLPTDTIGSYQQYDISKIYQQFLQVALSDTTNTVTLLYLDLLVPLSLSIDPQDRENFGKVLIDWYEKIGKNIENLTQL